MGSFIAKLGFFLRLLFGCTAIPEHSFFIKGKQFPICARCTGILIGFLSGILLVIIKGAVFITPALALLLILPLVLDGTVQQCTKYESTNMKRVVTGFLFGICMFLILVRIHFFTERLAKMTLDAMGIPYKK